MSTHPYGVQALRQGAFAFVQGRLLAGALNFAVALVLVRFMAIEQYAVYVTMGGLIVMLSEMAGCGLPHVISRYIPEGRIKANPGDLRRFVRILLLLTLASAGLIAGLFALVADPVARLLNATHARDAVIANCAFVFAYTVTQRLIHINESLLAQDAVRTGIAAEWLPKLALLVAWIALAGEITAAHALYIQAVTSLIGGVSLFGSLLRRLRALPAAGDRRDRWPGASARIGTFSLKSWAYTLILLFTESWAMRTLAAAFLSSVQMASFGFFHALTSSLRRYFPIHFLLVTMESVLIARFAETRDFARLNASANLLFKVNLAVLMPLVGLLTVIGAEVTTVLTGGKYADMAWIFPIVLLEPLLESHWYLLRTATNAIERPGILVKAAAIGLIPLAVILVLLAGHVGDPLPEILASMIALPLIRNFIVTQQLKWAGHRFRLALGGCVRIMGAAAFAMAGAFLCGNLVSLAPSPARAVIASLVFAVVYPAALLVLRPFSRPELDTIRQMGGDRLRVPALWGLGR